MVLRLSQYKSLVFDCDGVLLNSNSLKTDAFYNSASAWGASPANDLVKYHIQNGGVSRYQKFNYFMKSIITRYPELSSLGGPSVNDMILRYEKYLENGLMTCQITPSLTELRKLTQSSTWFIVSGGKQDELRDIFRRRELNNLFDGGIYGSPSTKDEILAEQLKESNLNLPALFLGDSKYDYLAASTAGLDFIFVSQWTELPEWEKFVKEKSLHSISYVKNLLNYHL